MLVKFETLKVSSSISPNPSYPLQHFSPLSKQSMERRKSRASKDELAIVKAAAWAWYQHGSGSEGRPMHEFDLTRTCRAPRPSRYKLEAMRIADNAAEGSNSPSPILSPPNTDNSLLDHYEIKRISQQLDHLIESSSGDFHREFHVGDGDRRQNLSSSETNGKKKNIRQNKKLKNGFWLRHGVICGRRQDVVDTGVLGGGGLRLPKHVRAVGVDNYKP